MKHRTLRAMALATVISLGVLSIVASTSTGSLGGLADSDGDGWFDSSNAALTLTLASATLPVPGGYEVLVDEVRFPLAPGLDGQFTATLPFQTVTIGTPVATRVRGVQGLGAAGTPFGATVRVIYHPPLNVGPAVILGPDQRVVFGEAGGPPAALTFPAPAPIGTPPVAAGTLTFTVATVTFPDPNPTNAAGDADVDAIPESTEARLAATFGGIFDPRAGSLRDIDLIIGHTDPSFTLSQVSRADLRSRFIQNGFNLHLDEGSLNAVAGAGGDMNLAGTTATPTGDVSVEEALAVRNANVGPTRRATAHFLLLAGSAAIKDSTGAVTGRAFGVTFPGAMVMRTGFIGINDLAWYQSGVLMHELGHGIGLCHPIFQDGATVSGSGGNSCGLVCGAIPVVQRDNGISVMGAPADDPNVVSGAINILRRPLDYSASQWPLIVPGCSFSP